MATATATRRRRDRRPGSSDGEPWQQRIGSFDDDDDDGDAAERVAEAETLHDHLLWQLHLSPPVAARPPHRRGADRRDRRRRLPARTARGASPTTLRPELQADARRSADRAAPAAALRPGRRRRARPGRMPAPATGAAARRHARQAAGAAHGRRADLERLPKIGVAGLAARTAMRPSAEVDARGAAAALARSAPGRADRRHRRPTPTSPPTA